MTKRVPGLAKKIGRKRVTRNTEARPVSSSPEVEEVTVNIHVVADADSIVVLIPERLWDDRDEVADGIAQMIRECEAAPTSRLFDS